MNILFLGYSKQETTLIDFLVSRNHDVNNSSNRFDDLSGYDLVISFGYRYIFKEYQLQTLNRPIINLHISYLPFNRGTQHRTANNGAKLHHYHRSVICLRYLYVI